MISMIAAVGKNNELGKDNGLIWHIPNDMKFFKKVTLNHKVIMGYNTYKSLPGKLPGREMIVLCCDKINDDSIETVTSIDSIVSKYKDSSEEVFVIGGGSVYLQFLDYASKIYLTEIDMECGDASIYFPKFNKDDYNKTILSSEEYNGIKYCFCIYYKK